MTTNEQLRNVFNLSNEQIDAVFQRVIDEDGIENLTQEFQEDGRYEVSEYFLTFEYSTDTDEEIAEMVAFDERVFRRLEIVLNRFNTIV